MKTLIFTILFCLNAHAVLKGNKNDELIMSKLGVGKSTTAAAGLSFELVGEGRISTSLGIGTSSGASASAILDMVSVTKAVQLPKSTNAAAISSPAEGMLIYDDSENGLSVYNGGSWSDLSAYTAPTVQKFTSGSGTYTKPAGVRYIHVIMVGGGGGGGGSSTSATNDGGDATVGGDSTFHGMTAGGGGAGQGGAAGGYAAGGTPTLGSGIGIGVTGSIGGGTSNTNVLAVIPGGPGATSALGGGGGSAGNAAGGAGVVNTGSGGGGGGATGAASCVTGGGGGSGAFISAFLTTVNATTAYSVGTGGNAGAAGTGGWIGGAGAAGQIVVREFY